ncbi:MAG TPA: efflux RND transporter periplasmic adaptor subunit [Tepidisphaeraceae bacterium]|jgi:RND family efflux transporter MFP subunit|nr:efflux RND transporter periplasmic adaptor subunit [Tepidisphaeraceae bacterium]
MTLKHDEHWQSERDQQDDRDQPQPQHDDHDQIPTDLPKVSTGSVFIAGVVIVIAFIALFIIGWIPRHHRKVEAEKDAQQQQDTRPMVETTQPTRQNKGFDLVLPADVRALQETPVYPRTSGYLKRWLVDIGDQVKEGQLLAEIDTPEVDAQLNQSKATLEQTKANVLKAQADMKLAQVTLQRYLDAQKQSPGSVTAQDVDEKRSAYDDAASGLEQVKASVVAQAADVTRLTVLQGFEKVVSPFGGVVTARNYDNGALLSAGNTAAGAELFRIQAIDTLRAFINVPQSYSTSIKIGQDGFLTVRNYSGKEFKGVVMRSAGALDPTTRTLRFEIDFPNKDGLLYAGMYGQARLKVTPDQPPMIVPTSAVVFDSEGTRVGVVEDNKFHFKKVTLGRDFGTEIEVASGLQGDEQIVKNPGTRTVEGTEVRLASSNAPAPTQQVSER